MTEMSGSGLPNDLQWTLQELRRLSHSRDDLQERYEALRDHAVTLLGTETVLVEDPATGQKLVAARREDEILEVDLKVIESECPEALDEVTKRTLDRPRFEKAVQRQLIPGDVVARAARYKPKTPFVAFTAPRDDE